MTDGPAPDVSVVVPTFKGALSLPELTDSVRRLLTERGLTYEFVLVNDASPDDTWNVIERLAEADPRIRGLDLLHNHGQPTATMCGLAASTGQIVATMDDDLEHRPEDLLTLLDALGDDPELDAVVAAWPASRSGFRDLGTRVHALADRIAWGTPRGFRHTAFRAMRRPVCDALVAHQTRLPVVGPMLHRVSSRVVNVEVQPGLRRHGTSGFTVAEGMRRVLRNFNSGSTAPLKAISALGLVLAVAAFAVGGAFLVRWMFGADSPSGWLSVMLTTTFIGGMNMLAFGVLGGYVDVIIREVRGSPRWSVRRGVGVTASDRSDS